MVQWLAGTVASMKDGDTDKDAQRPGRPEELEAEFWFLPD